jgi:hypothetical protein
VPAPVHTISDSSGVESPVPTVYRQGSPAQGSRMFERFASPPVPASVTRLDLHEGIEDGYDAGFDRHRRGAPVPAPTNARHPDSRSGRHRYQPPHRQPSQRTFQVRVSVSLLGKADIWKSGHHFHVRLRGIYIIIGSDTRASDFSLRQQSLRCDAGAGRRESRSGSLCTSCR